MGSLIGSRGGQKCDAKPRHLGSEDIPSESAWTPSLIVLLLNLDIWKRYFLAGLQSSRLPLAISYLFSTTKNFNMMVLA